MIDEEERRALILTKHQLAAITHVLRVQLLSQQRFLPGDDVKLQFMGVSLDWEDLKKIDEIIEYTSNW